MKGPRCQAENPAGMTFCDQCAARLACATRLVVAALIVSLAIIEPLGVAAQEREKWSRHLERAESASRRGEVGSALIALGHAYAAALETGRWEDVVEYADAMLGLRERPGLRGPITAKAREAYFIALRRARDARSMEGMLRAAEGFARLGDVEAFAYAARLIQLSEARRLESP